MTTKRPQPAPDIETARRRIFAEFERLNPTSKRHFDSIVRYQPYGYDRTGLSAAAWPHPMYIDHGKGPYVYDLEGRRILDMLSQNMSGVLGHAHPKVMAAAKKQLDKGMFFTLSNPLEGELAARLAERIPSIEKVRFNVSGGEATMMALRLAKAYTGRDKFAMADGGYHGSYDAVWASQTRNYSSSMMGDGRSVGSGIMPGAEQYAVSFPFNKLEESRRIIEENAQDLAAVIIEPILGGSGSIPATREYLQMLREVTRRHDIILIFDEMITLAVAKGGAQEYYDVIPDMTCGGKNVGGAFPMSFYGGRGDIIDLTAYGPDKSVPPVIHTGTYFAHPVGMAIGLAFLNLLTDDAYAHLQQMGELLREELRRVARRLEIPLQVTGAGHMYGYFWNDKPITDYTTAKASDYSITELVQVALLNKGFFTKGRGVMTTAHKPSHIKAFVKAFEDVVIECGLAT